jgi:hypothetical protein
MRLLSPFCLIGIATLSLAAPAHAQRAPAIPGFTGTLVTEETAKDEKKAEDKSAVAVKDAVTRDAKGPLSDLVPGTTVVIRHGSEVTEGVVSKIDVGANEITVRYDNKKTQKLVLTDPSSPDARTVEYSNDTKQKVTRSFKVKS